MEKPRIGLEIILGKICHVLLTMYEICSGLTIKTLKLTFVLIVDLEQGNGGLVTPDAFRHVTTEFNSNNK